MRPGTGQQDKRLTRDGLKEILQVNFELYRDEPDFYDYITTLVIYLMEYEFDHEAAGELARPGGLPPNPAGDAASRPAAQPVLQPYTTLRTRARVLGGCCPNCNNPVPADRKICPYCLAMVEQ